MSHIAEWSVKLFVFEYEDAVNARAELDTGTTRLVGLGHAKWIPGEPNVPEIGDEVAVSRALVDLAERLKQEAQADLGSLVSHQVLERRRRGDVAIPGADAFSQL